MSTDSDQERSDKQHAADELLARDAAYVLRPWTGTNEPVPAVSAKGCHLYDAYGTDFIDFTSGYFVNQAGHCHPKVVAAATDQLQKVTQVSGRHTTIPVVNLAEKLIQITPKSVHKVFFTTGGSESNEFALKMVRQKTTKTNPDKTDMASLENAYHGLSLGVLQGCSAKKYRDTAGVDLPDDFVRLPTAYCYRCPTQNNCKLQCLDSVEDQLKQRPNTAALIAEPIQAVGGIIPPVTWWQRLDEIRKRCGMYLILDEIQTGIGRTGAMFAAEHYGLEPDIITAGKGLSGGVGSLAATIVSDELGKDFFAGTTPTSAGNAVSAAAGFALVQTLEEENLVENAAKMGEYFTEAVNAIDDPWVGDVRFKGLLGGVELVSDRESKEILPKDAIAAVKDHLHHAGMLITVSGLHGNVLRLQPPLCITTQELDQFVSALKQSLDTVRSDGG